MTKIYKIAIFFILMVSLSIFWINNNAKKPIEIKPIKIEALNITKEPSAPKVPIRVPTEEQPLDILSKLKLASTTSKEGITLSEEETSTKVLQSLKKKIAQQEQEATPITKELYEVEKPTPKKVVLIKTHVKIVEREKKSKVKKESKVKLVTKTTRVPKIIVPKKKVVIQKTKTFQETIPKNTLQSQLSREEEVALYNNKYATTLEVVNISENFEIKEEEILPDAHYFEAIKTVKTTANDAPLEFVKKLGVLTVSDNYESNFKVSQKVEIAKEGIVNISSASIETDEMKSLKFVNTLGVIEVSKDFETTEAKKHLE